MFFRWLLLVAVASTAQAQGFTVDAAQSAITFHMKHKLHTFEGTSRAVEGRALLLATGAQVAVRARVDSFSTGDVNRDEHMKEVIEAARFPFVQLKAISDLTLPKTFPSTVQKTWSVELTLHGVARRLQIPITVKFESAERARAEAHFTVGLEEFGIERPSLMFMKVEDAMPFDAVVLFRR